MKRLLAFLLFFLSLSPFLHAQQQVRKLLDSLTRRAPYGIRDSSKVLLLNKIAELYSEINPDTGLRYGAQGMQIAREIEYKKGEALLHHSIGRNYMSKSELAKALVSFQDALKINEEIGNRQNQAFNLGNMGNVHYRLKNYDKALEYYDKALKINVQLGNKEKTANNLGNIGNIYSHYFDTSATGSEVKEVNKKKTLDYYHRAYELYKELGDKNGMARNLGNEGNVYGFDDDKTLAVERYSQAVKMYEDLGNKMFQAAFLINIANKYRDVAQDTSGKKRVGTYTRADKTILLNKSEEYAESGIRLAVATGFLEAVRDGFGTLSDVYYLKGDYKRAYETQKKYTDMADSMSKQSSAQEIGKLEAQYKLDQQDKEIKIQQLEVAKKRNTSFFLAGGMLLLLLVILFILKQRKKSEQLLLNILPAKIAERLKRKEHPIADQFSSASVMFIDMADFTSFSADRDPKELVTMLNDIFTQFDVIAEKHGLEKIKTIGDCYMAVSGLPQPRKDHALAAANMALEVREQTKDYKTKDGTPVHFRIGLDCGPVVAGVIGSKKFIYDLWGDPVNTASRMESTGVVGEIHCTEHFMRAVENRATEQEKYTFVTRGSVEIKGKGKMQTYLLKGVEMPETIILN